MVTYRVPYTHTYIILYIHTHIIWRVGKAFKFGGWGRAGGLSTTEQKWLHTHIHIYIYIHTYLYAHTPTYIYIYIYTCNEYMNSFLEFGSRS